MTSLRFGYEHTQICEAETSGTCTCKQVDVKLAGPGDLSVEPNERQWRSVEKYYYTEEACKKLTEEEASKMHDKLPDSFENAEAIRIHIGRFCRSGEMLS